MREQERVIELNNSGVFLLMAGEDGKAICRLRDSLAVLKSVVYPSASSNNTIEEIRNGATAHIGRIQAESLIGLSCFSQENQMASTSHQAYMNGTESNYEIPFSCHIPVTVGLRGLQNDSQAFIYSRPFTFNSIVSTRDLDHFLHVHSAVVIFNMALAHHRIGKSTGKRSFLEKAILFYDMCLELLENSGPHIGNAKLVELASLNNASLLRIEFGDHFVARRGLDLLSSLLVSADTALLSQMNEDDVRGFLLNIMLMQHALAAAAA